MKLRFTPASPFVRKVLTVAYATGIEDRIEKILTNPRDPESNLSDDNPLGKVPALITDEGKQLYDSPVICEYLDGLHDGPKLFPPMGEERWRALKLQALADGMNDAAVGILVETLRPEGEQSPAYVDKQKGKIANAIDALESEVEALTSSPNIGTIAVGCALGYLDFRFPDLDWRSRAPALVRWYDAFAANRFMTETQPYLPPS